jgi:hypothetical protein
MNPIHGLTALATRLAMLAAAAISIASLSAPAVAQAPPRIWNVTFGMPVTDLPAEFIMQACGSNGGPPTTPLESFAEFKRCPVEAATGLREVWFSYDDIAEYYMRARRASDELVDGARANTLFEQLVIYSVLVDADGKVQGYRIISDPRERIRARMDANLIAQPLMNVVFGAFGWDCVDLPPVEGERPFKGGLVKQNCQKVTNGRHVLVENRSLLKPGQQQQRIGEGFQANEFDVRVRIEVINAALKR